MPHSSQGQVTGYAFCVYEETKAVIGDVFALPGINPNASATSQWRLGEPAREIEETLLRHLFETLLNSPQVDRVESQLLLHPAGTHAAVFRSSGFEIFHRLFMVQPLEGHWTRPRFDLPAELGTSPLARRGPGSRRPPHLRGLSRPSRQPHQRPVPLRARLAAFSPQHRPLRRLRTFLALASHVVRGTLQPRIGRRSCSVRASARKAATSPSSASIPASGVRESPACCSPWPPSQFMRQGVSEISLTVTEANTDAIELYKSEGYECMHTFDAAVWQRVPVRDRIRAIKPSAN